MVRFHGLLIGIPGVREGQFIQESLAEFTVRVVAPHGLAPVDEKIIRDRVRARLGDVRVTVEKVDSTERTERGKFKAVISKISADERRRIQKGAT